MKLRRTSTTIAFLAMLGGVGCGGDDADSAAASGAGGSSAGVGPSGAGGSTTGAGAGGQTCMGTPTFGGVPLAPVESGPVAVALADLDGDGKADLVAGTVNTPPVLATYRGHGDGTFDAQVSNAIAGEVLDIAIGDVTGDGHPDALLATEGAGQPPPYALVLLEGMGDGTFGTAKVVDATAMIQHLVLFDADGDGKLDIAASAYTANATGELHIWKNLGAGAFATPVVYAAGAFPQGIAAADLNGDGKLDVAIANENGGDVSVFFGKGDGTFATPVAVAGDPYQVGIAAADLDGDGDVDLAVATATGFITLENGGAGTFVAPSSVHLFDSGQPAGPIAVGDLDMDGKPDVLVAEKNHVVYVAKNSGNGAFAAGPTAFAGAQLTAFAVGRIDGDATLDIVAVANASGEVTPLLGAGDGTFREFRPYAATANPISIVAADFDGDGRPDLATANLDGAIAVLRNQAGGTFGPPAMQSVGPGQYALPLATADLDGDGHADLIAGQEGGVEVLLGKGDGSFASGVPYPGGLADQVLVADVDADGKPDVVFVTTGGYVSIFHNAGGGVLSPGKSFPAAQGSSYFPPARAAAADIDGDGKLDLAVASRNAFTFFRGAGDGTFAAAPTIASPIEQPNEVAVADFDGDGHLDVAIGFDVYVTFARGDGQGGFTMGDHVPQANLNVTGFAVTDVDGDGLPDLIAASSMGFEMDPAYEAGELFLYRGQKGSMPQAPTRYVTGWTAQGLAIADLDGDGRLDIATADTTRGSANVLLGGCLP